LFERARKFFAEAGIQVQAVMTDNGACWIGGEGAKFWMSVLTEIGTAT
jgi:Na+/alanine symporter